MSLAFDAPFSSTTVAILLLSFLLLIIKLGRIESRRGSFPPGPKGLPFIGNIHQFSTIDQHKLYAQWGAQYGKRARLWCPGTVSKLIIVGDVVYAKFFRQPVIILNSAQAALDLMEKRGAKYSGRPRFVYLSEL